MESAMAQINVRMTRDLKQRGDAALAEAGISPSDAVRSLWTKAARRGEALEELRRVLFEDTEETISGEAGALVRDGWAIADKFYASVGFDRTSAAMDGRPWDELYRDAMDEHFSQKGLFQ